MEAWMGTPHSGVRSPGTRHMLSKHLMRKRTGGPKDPTVITTETLTHCSYHMQAFNWGFTGRPCNTIQTTASKASTMSPLQGGKLRLSEVGDSVGT